MTTLDNLPIIGKDFLDKTSVLYGGSGSGKSTIIFNILHELRNDIKQIIVIAPTDRTNGAYSGTSTTPGVVPKPLVHHTLSEELLIKIWERQEMLTSIYKQVNDPVLLESIYMKLGLGSVNKILSRADVAKADKIIQISDQYVDKTIVAKKVKEIEDQYNEFKILIYKRYISANIDTLIKMGVGADGKSREALVLKYININPRMVIIFDDCSAEFKNLKTKEGKTILEKMFFQGRWAMLTILIAVHDDKMLDSELRKNAFISIFTNSQSAIAYLTRPINGFPRSVANKVISTFNDVYIGHQKLAYVRSQEKFYRLTATPCSGFVFGAPIISEYCSMIQSTGGNNVGKSNDFYDYFS